VTRQPIPLVILLASLSAAAIAQPDRAFTTLAQADAALQSGEADNALTLLSPVLSSTASAPALAEAHNLACRVHLTIEQWDAAINDCEQATRLVPENDPGSSDDHLWLARALGQKASRASFMTAFSLAKRSRAEFEEAVRIDPRNGAALSDLGDFDRQAPSIVGGGIDKARDIAGRLDKVDPARAHKLLAQIAEQQKDMATAESEYKQSVASSPHPADAWAALAGFYSRVKRFPEMESAINSGRAAALHDKHSGTALYDGAGLLIESSRDPALAANMLNDYLTGSSKTEEAPAFIAHIRLARLKQQLGDPAAAVRERAAALALAHEYKPAQEFRAQLTPP